MDIKKELSRFVPVEINQDTSMLKQWEKEVLDKLFEVAKIYDELFFSQVYSKNHEAYTQVVEQGDIDKLKLFQLYYGPFNRLEHNKSFVEGHKKPLGANFYPEDMTKEEFETFLKENPDKKAEFTTHLSLIRRDENKKLIAIPYNVAYKKEIEKCSIYLKEAAEISQNKSLSNYFIKLAQAMQKNDYFESDCAWMDLDSRIEPTIGPYEVYEDELFGLKAAFEFNVGIKDNKESEELAHLEKVSKELEDNLPIKIEHEEERGTHSPIAIVNLWLSAGMGRDGVHYTAFNLPNDEKVRAAKGSKKIMLKNIGEGKYEGVTTKILDRIFEPNIREKITFDSFFKFVLLHEISHGIGPGYVTVNEEKNTVNGFLKETYSAIEEAKADVVGAYNSYYLEEKGIYEKGFAQSVSLSYIAGIFRAIRFGLTEAHAAANIIAYTYLKEQGVISFNEETKKYHIEESKLKIGIDSLSKEILEIEATGDYERAKEFQKKYSVVPDELHLTLKLLEDIPTDILPTFKKDVK